MNNKNHTKKIKQNKKSDSRVGVRINKYLAMKKVSTRRDADELVVNKKVFINGKLAILGDKVNEQDLVEIKKRGNKKKYVYFAYNKPVGTVTHSPQREEHDIKKNIKGINLLRGIARDIFPLGRLDKKSNGLIILTNDGRITDQLLSPKYSHEKEYIVRTSNKLRSNFKQKMEAGVNIEGYITKKCKVAIVNKFTFKIILTEGKKHQIRRMCSALFQEVSDLKRIRIMNILLDNLKVNDLREIKGTELDTFLKPLLTQS